MSYDYSYNFDGDLEAILEEIFYSFEEVFYSFEEVFADFDIGAVIAIAAIPLAILFIAGLIGYIIKSCAFSGLGKKFGKGNANLAWVPVFHDAFCMLVLSDLTAKPYFSIHPKIDKVLKLHDRKTAFYVYLGCSLVLPLITTGISYVFSFLFGLIPVIGIVISALIGFVLGLLPTVIIAVFKFAYLRDVLDALKRDRDDNQRMALVITIANLFVPIVEPIYLLTLRKYTPLAPEEYCNPYNAYPGANPYGAPGFNPYAAPGNAPFGAQPYPPYTAPGQPPYAPPYCPPVGEASDTPYGTQPPFNASNGNYGYPPPPPPFNHPGNAPFGSPANPPYGTPGNVPYGVPGNPPYGAPFNNPPSPPPQSHTAPEAPTPPTPSEAP